MERQHDWGATGQASNVLEQAMSVIEDVEASGQRVSLTLDLEQPGHRAALAAALAVLRSLGEPADEVMAPAGPVGDRQSGGEALPAAVEAPVEEEELEGEVELRRAFGTAIGELTPDTERQAAIVRDTFPRVRELLRDGANVEAVAQIQYRRWLEEHPGDAHRN
jgi:hypothetical protein